MNNEALSRRSIAGHARLAAMTAFQGNDDFLFRTVDYNSIGRCLVLGPGARVEGLVAMVRDAGLDCTALVTDDERPQRVADNALYQASLEAVSGHLGAWQIVVRRDGRSLDFGELVHGHKTPHFDLLFDLTTPPQISAEIAPLGYFTPRDNAAELAAVETARNLVGEFQKPRFFNYDPGICAHGRSGIAGCTRCIDACPTDAITSIGESIDVDAYRCQGGGVCAAVCPSGAMTYAYPPVRDSLNALHEGLARYAAKGGTGGVILVHDDAQGQRAVDAVSPKLAENVIPFVTEEAASVGLEAWLAAMAWGASAVRIVMTPGTAPSVRAALEHQFRICAAMLEFAGYPADCVTGIEADELTALTAADNAPEPTLSTGATISERAGFAPVDGKRSVVRLAYEHLCREAPASPSRDAIAILPEGAPFGAIAVDQDKCTLCMSCASVCPAAAITTGGDTPALRFTEWSCVQCGTCKIACPETAISLVPRYVIDTDVRMSTRTLHEEAPFACVVCGKAFATASVMRRMQEKLRDHWMFQNPEQMRRLQMCEDCRVTDLYAAEGGLTITPTSTPGDS